MKLEDLSDENLKKQLLNCEKQLVLSRNNFIKKHTEMSYRNYLVFKIYFDEIKDCLSQRGYVVN